MQTVEKQAGVAQVVLDLSVWDPIGEAENVVHDENGTDFIHDFILVESLHNVGFDKANENDLEDRAHHKDEELNDENVAKHHHRKCKNKSSNVIVAHILDQSVATDICSHLRVDCTVLLSRLTCRKLVIILFQ